MPANKTLKLLFLLTFSCSSLEQLPSKPDTISIDTIPNLAFTKPPDRKPGGRDFRIRTKPSKQIRFHWAVNDAQLSNKELFFIFKSRLLSWSKELGYSYTKHSFSRRKTAWPDAETYIKLRQKYFRKNNVQATILSTFKEDESKGIIETVVYDAVTAEEYYKVELEYKKGVEPSNNEAAFTLVKEGKYLVPLEKIDFQKWNIAWATLKGRLGEVIREAKGARVWITSAQPDVLVKLNGRPVGALPVSDTLLKEGKHTIKAIRKGYPDQVRTFYARSFDRMSFNFAYPDDTRETTVRIATYPPGKPVYLYGRQQGPTPLAMTGLAPKKVPMQVRTTIDEEDFILFDRDLNLKERPEVFNVFIEKLDLPFSNFEAFNQKPFDLWQPMPLSLVENFPSVQNGMMIGRQGSSQRDWLGLYSRSVVPYVFKLQLALEQHENSRFIFGLIPENSSAKELKDGLFLFGDNGTFWGASEGSAPLKEPEESEPAGFYKLKEPTPTLLVDIEYHHFDQEFELKVQDSSVLEGGFAFAGDFRIILMAQNGDDSETVVLKNLKIRSIKDD